LGLRRIIGGRQFHAAAACGFRHSFPTSMANVDRIQAKTFRPQRTEGSLPWYHLCSAGLATPEGRTALVADNGRHRPVLLTVRTGSSGATRGSRILRHLPAPGRRRRSLKAWLQRFPFFAFRYLFIIPPAHDAVKEHPAGRRPAKGSPGRPPGIPPAS